MYAAPSVFCSKENIIRRELKRIEGTWGGDRGEGGGGESD